jgi:hypothetical protein
MKLSEQHHSEFASLWRHHATFMLVMLMPKDYWLRVLQSSSAKRLGRRRL